jgi:hypothetical protein
MEPHRDDDKLIAELRALRPVPHPAFAAELDGRAAAGFPRRSRLDLPPLVGLRDRLRGMTPRRALLPIGATAVAALAIATALVATNESKPGGIHPSSAVEVFGSGATKESSSAPGHAAAPRQGSSGVEREAAVPTVTEQASGALASGAAHRDVERSAEIVLGANPTEVAEDAAEVFETVHAYDGIVMRSSTREGAAGEAGARFEMLIPSAKLSDALAAFSGIAEVRSRHEATADITAPTVSLGELLQDSRARIDSLLTQLAGAETESEREAVEAELRTERRHAASLRSRLTRLHRRANFARVSLRIETGDAATSSSGGGWGVGDALHDAGHILAIAAAVTLIGLAVIGPLALIALLAWLAHRSWVRRERQRTLG